MRKVSPLLVFGGIQLSAISEPGWTAAGTSEAPPGFTALISGPPYSFPALRQGRQYLRQISLQEEGRDNFDFYDMSGQQGAGGADRGLISHLG